MKGITLLFLGITVAAARELPLASTANEQIQAEERADTVLPLSRIALPAETENENIHGNFNNGTVRRGCPPIADIPIADPDLKHFYGARIYTDRGNSVPALACNGNKYDLLAGTMNPDSANLLGSVFIHEGCTFYGFSGANYDDGPFDGPIVINGPANLYNYGYDDYYVWFQMSFIIDCQQRMPDCAPSDEWQIVASMDNSGSSQETMFTYTYKKGTSWSNEVSNGFDVNKSVTATLQASFFKIFSAEVSTSYSTGYNWQTTSSEAKSEEKTFTIQTPVAAGTIIKIEQATGLCGNSLVHTEMFRNTDLRTGVSTTFVH